MTPRGYLVGGNLTTLHRVLTEGGDSCCLATDSWVVFLRCLFSWRFLLLRNYSYLVIISLFSSSFPAQGPFTPKPFLKLRFFCEMQWANCFPPVWKCFEKETVLWMSPDDQTVWCCCWCVVAVGMVMCCGCCCCQHCWWPWLRVVVCLVPDFSRRLQRPGGTTRASANQRTADLGGGLGNENDFKVGLDTLTQRKDRAKSSSYDTSDDGRPITWSGRVRRVWPEERQGAAQKGNRGSGHQDQV